MDYEKQANYWRARAEMAERHLYDLWNARDRNKADAEATIDFAMKCLSANMESEIPPDDGWLNHAGNPKNPLGDCSAVRVDTIDARGVITCGHCAAAIRWAIVKYWRVSAVDGWQRWHGTGTPPQAWVAVIFRGGGFREVPSDKLRWEHTGATDDVVAYRCMSPSLVGK